jgi:hypothetical protein
MSVTINNTGSKSRQIVVDNEFHPAQANGVIDKINTCLTDLGWTLYDTALSTEPPENARIAGQCFTTKVYSAVCRDGDSPSTKYMILRYDAPRQYFYMSCCESWNTSTKVPTNECWTQNRGFPIPLSTNHYVLYIFASARYCVMVPVIRGEQGLWQGIFEFEREASDDNATKAPCFGYTNGVIFGSPFYALTSNFNASTQTETSNIVKNNVLPFWIPRLSTGEVGLAAARNTSLFVAGSSFPPPTTLLPRYSNNNIANTVTYNYGQGLASIFGTNVYRGNSNNFSVYLPKVSSVNSAASFRAGRIYGINIAQSSLGNVLDTYQIPLEGNTGHFNTLGTNTTCFALNILGGSQFTCGVNTAASGLLRDRLNFEYIDNEPSPANVAHFFDGVVVRGKEIYLTCGNTTVGYPQLKKYNLDTNTWSNITLPGNGDSLVYDGGNNIYVSTTVGITRVNVDNNAIIANLNMASNLAGGAAALAIDDRYVYALQQTVSTTNNQIAVVNSSFSVERYINSLSIINAGGRYSMIFSPDYSNNRVIVLGSQHTAPSVALNQYVVSGANGATIANSTYTISVGTSAAGNTLSCSSFYYDNNYIFIRHNVPYAGFGVTGGAAFSQQVVLHTGNLVFISSGGGPAASSTIRESGDISAAGGISPFKMREAIPFKGYRLSNGHRGGISGPISESFFTSNYDHSSETTMPSTSLSVANVLSSQLPMVAGGCCFSDGIWYYRFSNNQANGVSKVFGQYSRMHNNLGLSTPTILISS